MALRPGLWPTVITVPALALLVGLGLWQLDRHVWKQGILAALDSARQATPAPLPAVIDDARSWRFRPVIVEGHFLAGRQFRVFSPRRQGWTIHQPLVRRSGAPVLVHRGTDLDGLSGPVRLTGVARIPEDPGWFAPANDPAANEWYWPDLAAMADTAGLDRLAPVVVDVVAWREGGLPRPHNRHLGYALTWFAFAVILAVAYVVDARRRGRGGQQP